jgi:hypothetical protein
MMLNKKNRLLLWQLGIIVLFYLYKILLALHGVLRLQFFKKPTKVSPVPFLNHANFI